MNLSKFIRSETQNQFSGLLINVQMRPFTMSFLKNMCFQNNMCPESTLGEFAISLPLVNMCEPVNEETESRNFSDLEVQPLQMAINVQQSYLSQYSTWIYKGTSSF